MNYLYLSTEEITMKQFTAFCFLWVVGASHIGFAQEWQINSLTTSDGLSQGHVHSLYKDSRGYIWIGTKEGLNRFDGVNIKNYAADPFSPWGLPGNEILKISEDKHGLLWLASDKGLIVFDPFTERFFLLHQSATLTLGPVQYLAVTNGSDILALQRVDNKEKIIRIQIPKDLVQRIRNGHISSEIFQISEFRHEMGTPLNFATLFVMENNQVVTFDTEKKMCLLDLQNHIIRPVRASELPLEYEGNYALLYDNKRKKALLFAKPESDSTIYRNLHFAEFMVLPDGRKLTYRPTNDNIIYQVEITNNQNISPHLTNFSFYNQFKQVARIDKNINGGCVMVDDGNLWIGTAGYGVRVMSYYPHQVRQVGKEVSFYNMTYLPGDRIWPGIFYQPIFLDLSKNIFSSGSWNKIMAKGTELYGMHYSKNGNLWAIIANFNTYFRLLKYDDKSGICKEIPTPVELHFQKDVPLRILEDQKGFIWIAGNNGQLLRVHPGHHKVEHWNMAKYFSGTPPLGMRSYSMLETSHQIWIGTSAGLIMVNNQEKNPSFEVLHQAASPIAGMKSFEVLSILKDPRNTDQLWLGTRAGGLSQLNLKTRRAKTFTTKEGLTNNVVYGILSDDFDRLWISTNKGISLFYLQQEKFSALFKENSPMDTEFNTGAYLRLPSGQLAFGSVDGLFLIKPGKETTPPVAPRVLVHQIQLNGIELDFSDSDILQLQSDLSYRLELPYQKNNISLSFSALPFNFPNSFQYRYRISGKNEEWIPLGTKNTVSLADLPSGGRTVELQAATFNADWSEAITSRVHIQIAPPWYNTHLAWISYLAILTGLTWYIFRIQRNRLQLQYSIDLSKREAAKLKALDEFKNKVLGYISHEFKTPLTIILGLTDRLKENLPASEFPALKSGIVHQTDNMLELVNQIMDIVKSGEKTLSLSWRQGNISRYIQYLTESFRPLSEMRQIDLRFYTASPDLVMDFDPERIKYILHNLLSNALRHTSSQGEIEVRLDYFSEDTFLLQVTDNGEGIAAQELPRLFERHFVGNSDASKEGRFGLGLPFVKDIVQLHHGVIEVESTKGIGTTFSIRLPINREAQPFEYDIENGGSPFSSIQKSTTTTIDDNGKPMVLVVEDNPVIADWIGTILNPTFRLLFATNGKTGFDLAVQHIPDIVLTDLIMPEEDGLALTHKLKAHELTNHIPILMLSAQDSIDDRIESRRMGVNAFMAKPFYPQELLLALLNLQAHQERLRQRYSSSNIPLEENQPQFSEAYMADTDYQPELDPFMVQLLQVFEENYANESFNREELCKTLLISKSQLQRKVAAISSFSPMEMLRNFRLEKARLLLEQNPELQIKEISTMVGFADPAHFSKVFSKTYGTPAITLKKGKNGNPVEGD